MIYMCICRVLVYISLYVSAHKYATLFCFMIYTARGMNLSTKVVVKMTMAVKLSLLQL